MEFETGVVLSASSGIMLCESFSNVQALADFIFAGPTMTHNFASEKVWEVMKQELVKQHSWLDDEDTIFLDYPNFAKFKGNYVKRQAITDWLCKYIFPEHGATMNIEKPDNPKRISFGVGLPNHI